MQLAPLLLLPGGQRYLSHENRHNARAKPGQRPAARPDRGPQQQQQQQPSQRAAPRKPKARINGDIRAAQVRAVLPDGSNQVLPIAEALRLAQGLGLDLVEVPGTSNPVVAKVVDWEAVQSQQRKADDEAARRERLRAKLATPKEMQFTSRIGDHDIEIKMRKVHEFLDSGLKVLLVVKRRREEGGAAALALDYLLERLKGERPGLEVSKRTEGSRSMNTTVSWPPAVARALKGE